MAIWQDLVDDHGFGAGYASVKRFVGRLKAAEPDDAHPRIETAPGEEGQVDYGDGPMVRHPDSHRYRRTRLFVFTLGYSRKAVRLLTLQVVHADMGGAARARFSPAWRGAQGRRARQLARRRHHP
jgi:transposase